jgi:hypothetical protein
MEKIVSDSNHTCNLIEIFGVKYRPGNEMVIHNI